MNDTIIAVERLSKRYRLGQIGAKTLGEAVQRWWHTACGRDAEARMGQVDRDAGAAPRARRAAAWPEEIWALRDVSFEVKQGEPESLHHDRHRVEHEDALPPG